MLDPIALDATYDRPPRATLVMVVVIGGLALWWLKTPPPAELLFTPGDVRPWQFVTATFLHADPWHALVNGIYLWVFGRYVEDRLGYLRFTVLFLLFGVAGKAVYLWRGADLPSLGASGAVVGLMGMVLATAPRIGMRVRFGWFAMRAHPPAWLLLGLWLLLQLWNASREAEHGIAYTSHLGGFLAGFLASVLLRQPVFRGTGWHLPRARHAGATVSPAYDRMLREEAVWRTIEEHLAAKRRAEDRSPPPAPRGVESPPRRRNDE